LFRGARLFLVARAGRENKPVVFAAEQCPVCGVLSEQRCGFSYVVCNRDFSTKISAPQLLSLQMFLTSLARPSLTSSIAFAIFRFAALFAVQQWAAGAFSLFSKSP